MNDVFVFVPDTNQIIRVAKGTGDNLLREDRRAGYCDYLVYEQYSLEQDMPELDGGMLMLKKYAYETYSTLSEAVPEILELAYGERKEFVLLANKDTKTIMEV